VNVRNDALHRSTLDSTELASLDTALRVWIVVLLLFASIVTTQLISAPVGRVITDVGWTAAAFLATISSIRTARNLAGRERTAWFLFASASGAWTLGMVAWDVNELILGISAPFPSISDAGFILFGLLMGAGMLVLRSTLASRQLTWLRVANLGLVLCGLAVVMMVMLTQPFTRASMTLPAALVIVVENAAITVACIIAMYTLWSYHWESRLTSTALLTAGLAMHTIAGVFYARDLIVEEYSVGKAFDIVWIVAFAFQDCAARARLDAKRRDDERHSSRFARQQGWVEAVLPSALLLCMAVNALTLVDEITPRVAYFGSLMLGVFAIVLSLRESMLYVRGQRTHEQLEEATAQLTRKTEQMQALNTQREALERRIEVTAQAGGVGLWEWEVGSPEVYYSPEWKRQLGYSADEFPNTFDAWRERLHPDDRDRMQSAVADFIGNPQGEFIAEQRLLHRDGTYRWILVRGIAVFDAEGKPQTMLGSHVDITDRKLIELSLRESEARYRELVDQLETRVASRTSELTDAYRESRNFAYAVAHDLKAPLRAIDGFGHLLDHSASPRLNAEEREYLKRVRRGAVQMSSLIDGLLDYSRLEHRDLRFCAIECCDLIEDILQSMESVIHASKATVTVAVAPGRVRADVEGLRIIIRNLLDNALKFASPSRSPRVVIGSYEEPDAIVLTIQDNGIGFDPQYREKIFDIFNRLHASGYDGTGIGLALVRKSVQRMHGQVWAQSTPDQGATFFVRLPVAGGVEPPVGCAGTAFDEDQNRQV
jgi:PAS domain S-box-containing protein